MLPLLSALAGAICLLLSFGRCQQRAHLLLVDSCCDAVDDTSNESGEVGRPVFITLYPQPRDTTTTTTTREGLRR